MFRNKPWLLLCPAILCVGFASLYPLQKRFDQSVGSSPRILEETLYLPSGKTVRRMSVGFEGVVSDVYWIRTVQYFGQKVLGDPDHPRQAGQALIEKENFRLLSPLLNVVVDIDPQYSLAYAYGSTFLGEFDLDAAVALLNKGIAETKKIADANPSDPKARIEISRLYAQLGYTYWRAKRYAESSQAYERAADFALSPKAMRLMAEVMKSRGSDRATAYAIFDAMFRDAEDDTIHSLARTRLEHLKSLDERDFYNRMLGLYKTQYGKCPDRIQDLLPVIKAHLREALDGRNPPRPLELRIDSEGRPSDPANPSTPYSLNSETCRIELGARTYIPIIWDAD